jgi:uncharacterized protein YdaU (DUF1376 family)
MKGNALNYYEHHLGDWIRDTVHLSLLEEGVYRRLIDQYYIREKPLPLDLNSVYRLARANSKLEQSAVVSVLGEFFTQGGDGFHSKRCDSEIAEYHNGLPAADAKRENERERQRRARDRRKQLFATLRELGHVAPWDATTDELQTALSHATNGAGHEPVTPPVTRDNTAIQSPDTIHHKEEESVGSADIVRVFDHWTTVHGKSRSKLDDKRKKLIRAALKIYPAETLCQSIDGYKRSEFHQGKNDRRTVYDDIEIMLRDAKQIDAGIAYTNGGTQKWL